MEHIRFSYIVIFFIVITQCGVNCFIPSPFSINDRQDRTASQQISRLIADARGAATNTRNEANDIAAEIENTSSRFFTSININISSSINNIFNPTYTLIESALNQNSSAAECAQQFTEDVASAINETLLEWIECKTNKTNAGLAIVDLLLQNANNATIFAQNVTRELGNCLSLASGSILGFISPQVLYCKLRLVVSAGRNFTNLMINKKRNLIEAGIVLLNLKAELAACNIIAFANAAESASNIIADVASCFANSTSSG